MYLLKNLLLKYMFFQQYKATISHILWNEAINCAKNEYFTFLERFMAEYGLLYCSFSPSGVFFLSFFFVNARECQTCFFFLICTAQEYSSYSDRASHWLMRGASPTSRKRQRKQFATILIFKNTAQSVFPLLAE